MRRFPSVIVSQLVMSLNNLLRPFLLTSSSVFPALLAYSIKSFQSITNSLAAELVSLSVSRNRIYFSSCKLKTVTRNTPPSYFDRSWKIISAFSNCASEIFGLPPRLGKIFPEPLCTLPKNSDPGRPLVFLDDFSFLALAARADRSPNPKLGPGSSPKTTLFVPYENFRLLKN